MIDETTTISGKSVLVVCFRLLLLLTQKNQTRFFDLQELDGTTANVITETLLSCLHKYGFLGECFMAFVCDGASLMLGRKAGVATQLCARFLDLFMWHCLYHRLELAVGDVLKEGSGLNHFKIFFDKLYTLFHVSAKCLFLSCQHLRKLLT